MLNLYEKFAHWSSIKNAYENSSADSTMDNVTEISPASMMDIAAIENTTEDAVDEEIRQIL